MAAACHHTQLPGLGVSPRAHQGANPASTSVPLRIHAQDTCGPEHVVDQQRVQYRRNELLGKSHGKRPRPQATRTSRGAIGGRAITHLERVFVVGEAMNSAPSRARGARPPKRRWTSTTTRAERPEPGEARRKARTDRLRRSVPALPRCRPRPDRVVRHRR
jgi:hypothetical protein